jgi:membrane-associated phospholipid phosphatase
VTDSDASGAPVDEAVDPTRPLADAARDSEALRRARRRAAAIGAALLAVACGLTIGVLADPVHPWFQSVDDWIWSWTRAHQYRPVVQLAKVLDVVGSAPVTLSLRTAAAVVLVVRRRWTQLGIFVGAIVLSELCIGPLKSLVGRPRPPASLVGTSGASFPSGHAIAAAVTAFGLVIAFLPRGRRRLRWGAVAAVTAASMAASRVYLRAHWASDTAAGVCLGVGLAVLIESLVEGGRGAVARNAAQQETAAADERHEAAQAD